jgi:hypothetical protein
MQYTINFDKLKALVEQHGTIHITKVEVEELSREALRLFAKQNNLKIGWTRIGNRIDSDKVNLFNDCAFISKTSDCPIENIFMIDSMTFADVTLFVEPIPEEFNLSYHFDDFFVLLHNGHLLKSGSYKECVGVMNAVISYGKP